MKIILFLYPINTPIVTIPIIPTARKTNPIPNIPSFPIASSYIFRIIWYSSVAEPESARTNIPTTIHPFFCTQTTFSCQNSLRAVLSRVKCTKRKKASSIFQLNAFSVTVNISISYFSSFSTSGILPYSFVTLAISSTTESENCFFVIRHTQLPPSVDGILIRALLPRFR